MAVVKGVKEQVHLPLYDCVEVKPGKQLGSTLTSNLLRFFVDVTGKTKLLTNMQAASLLPHWNTFEARALRVVISDLGPRFGDESVEVTWRAEVDKLSGGGTDIITFKNTLTMSEFVTLARRATRDDVEKIEVDESTLNALGLEIKDSEGNIRTLADGTTVTVDLIDLRSKFEQKTRGLLPPAVQIFPHNGHGNVIGNFIYNTVTTFYVGEKIMIQVPTWFFPAGAGPYSEDGGTITHGYPNPQATFRFAEPVTIETQQNFRVEIEIPESDVLKEMQRLYGPLFIWVVLDGYMTRDVQ
ncbi:MAG TPA: hypothetical protein VF088_02815 [Pyrinomonadaceae bacterium]